MTTENNDNKPAATLADVLTKDEVVMVWQLLNAQGNGAPFAVSHIAAGLYAKVQAAAKTHGFVVA